MSVLVTGGTGWIGRHLLKHLDSPRIVSRNASRASKQTGLATSQIVECDLGAKTIDRKQMGKHRAVVNLMGDSIADGRWTAVKKKRIRDSRITATRNLVQSLMDADSLPDVVVSASATGYYGECGDEVVTESRSPGHDFLSEVCADWEEAVQPLAVAGVRVCRLRIGLVIGQGGGAMQKTLPPFRLGLGGRLGSGQHWMPWVHLDDLVGMIHFLLDNRECHGAFNGSSPNPVRNSDFTRALGEALKRPAILPVPSIALRVLFGEFAKYLCVSQRVVPQALESAGFQFRFPDIGPALQQVIQK